MDIRVAAQTVYTIVLALWTGGIAIFTFVVTPAIFKGYGRDMAAQIVDKLFPVYFAYTLALSVLAMAMLLFAGADRMKAAFKVSLVLIALAIAVNAFVSFRLHPDIKQVKSEIVSFEARPKEDPLRRKFSRLHAVSATLNLLLLADGVALLVISSALRK
jgi:hypothetical protein